jgi:hypothetical protein
MVVISGLMALSGPAVGIKLLAAGNIGGLPAV